jgi:hypothetical protein
MSALQTGWSAMVLLGCGKASGEKSPPETIAKCLLRYVRIKAIGNNCRNDGSEYIAEKCGVKEFFSEIRDRVHFFDGQQVGRKSLGITTE